jgi:hypothetical protein
MPAYRVPTFPLSVNVWRNGNPVANPPDVVTVGNLSPGRRVMVAAGTLPLNPATTCPLYVEVLLPRLTDVRGVNTVAGPDTVEVPAGSLRYYTVLQVDDIGKGFANEHRFAVLAQQSPWSVPID